MELIKNRRSIKEFIDKKIDKETILEILECGRWAPSDQNSQPWRVCAVIHPTVKRMLSELSKDGKIIEDAYLSLAIFLDIEKSDNRKKSILAVGAFMQNILLGVSALGEIGAVWIGEILEQKEKVNQLFKLPVEKFELMGVIAVGYFDEEREKASKESRERRTVDEFVEWY